MTRQIVLLMICAAALCLPHSTVLAKEGGAAPLKPKPAATVGPYTEFRVELRFWGGDAYLGDCGIWGTGGDTPGALGWGAPGGQWYKLFFLVPPGAVLAKSDLDAYLDKNSARMYPSAATTFCLDGVRFYLYSPGADRCEVRITRRESWITRQGQTKLVDEHSLGWLSTRVFEPGVTLYSK